MNEHGSHIMIDNKGFQSVWNEWLPWGMVEMFCHNFDGLLLHGK